MSENKSLYLPGLNGIRAIAAILVVLSHVSLKTSQLGFPKNEGIKMAAYGVTMFFVLSGYLITTLLLKENDKTGKISLRKFYIRRIFRIWPIYYLIFIVALAWSLFNQKPVKADSIFFYSFLMANVPFVFGGTIAPIVQLWSVGVEEQFYLFWPWLFRREKRLPYLMLGIFILLLSLKIVLRILENGQWYSFVGVIEFQSMSLGGLAAWAIHKKRQFIQVLYNPLLQLVCWFILLISVYQPIHIFSIFDGELYAFIFLVIIVNVSTNPKAIIKLDQPIMNWLGRISYGIYVYHMFAIIIVFNLVEHRLSTSFGSLLIVYLLVVATTLIVAHLSYQYFESWFLSKKEKFAVVPSTNSKKTEGRSQKIESVKEVLI